MLWADLIFEWVNSKFITLDFFSKGIYSFWLDSGIIMSIKYERRAEFNKV